MQKRIVTGVPLTPTSLVEMKAFEAFPAPPEGFAPGGDWTLTWRIWTCHGYRNSGNEDHGFLRVERISGRSGEPFTLKVDRQINHDAANVHIVHAEIICRADELASPSAWTLRSRFLGPDGRPRKELDANERVKVAGGAMEISVNGKTFRREVSPRITADWCLFEALGRRGPAAGPLEAFDMLEGLSLVRTGHRLSYRGPYAMETSGGTKKLHWFEQLGHGTWPYEYWLDDDHRVVAAVTNSRAYILDNKAVETIKQSEIGSREYEQQRQRKRKGDAA